MMKNKKWLALAMAGVMSLSLLTACGGGDDGEEYVEDEEIVESEEPVEEDPVEEEPAYVQIPAVIINGTGVDIAALYVSGAGLEVWGDNMIPEGMVLPHGNYMDLTLNVDQNNIQWDIRIEDKEGVGITFMGLDISEMPADGFGIELLIEDGTPTCAALADPSQMEGNYTPAGEAPADSGDDMTGPVSDETWAVLEGNATSMGQMMQIYDAVGAPEECVDALNAASALVAEMGEGNREDFTEESAVYYLAQINEINAILVQYLPQE